MRTFVMTVTGMLVAGGLLLSVASPAVARWSDGSVAIASPTPTKQPAKTKRQEWRTERRVTNIRNYWTNMKKRLEIIVRNEERIVEKIEAKIDQRASTGKFDVAAARVKLEAGKKLIAEAKEMLAGGTVNVEKIITSSTDEKVASEQVRKLNKDVLAKIRAAHEALRDALSSISRIKPTPSPTPTPSPSGTQ